MVNALQDKINISGGVLQPDQITESFADQLGDGDIEVKVLSVIDENPELASKYSENWMVECEYPDGFIAHHQVAKTGGEESFLTAIRNKLRARHGVAHGRTIAAGEHALDHVAGDLIGTLPNIAILVGETITFKKVG